MKFKNTLNQVNNLINAKNLTNSVGGSHDIGVSKPFKSVLELTNNYEVSQPQGYISPNRAIDIDFSVRSVGSLDGLIPSNKFVFSDTKNSNTVHTCKDLGLLQKVLEYQEEKRSRTSVVAPTGVKSYARLYDNDTPQPPENTEKELLFCNQGKFLLSVDWLSLRLAQTINFDMFGEDGILEKPSYKLELLEGGTEHYKHRANVFCKNTGDHLGVLAFEANKKMFSGSMVYKITNHCFYDKTYMSGDFRDVLTNWFFEELNTEILNISRLDIAIDGVDLEDFVTDYFKYDKYERLGKSKMQPYGYDDRAKKYEGFYCGTLGNRAKGQKRGKKIIRYYCKTQEIQEKNLKKKYILDYFKNNGFDLDKEVYRLELQLNSEAINDIGGFKLSHIYDVEKLSSILEFHFKNFFEFVPADSESTDSVRSRRPRVQIVDFSNVCKSTYHRVKRAFVNGLRTTKIVVKSLLHAAFTDDTENGFYTLKTVSKLVKESGLTAWLTQKSSDWRRQFEKEAYLLNREVSSLLCGRSIDKAVLDVGNLEI